MSKYLAEVHLDWVLNKNEQYIPYRYEPKTRTLVPAPLPEEKLDAGSIALLGAAAIVKNNPVVRRRFWG